MTLKQAAEMLRARSVSPVELTEACLRRIEKYNPSFNAFITVTKDQVGDGVLAIEGRTRQLGERFPVSCPRTLDELSLHATTVASRLTRPRSG